MTALFWKGPASCFLLYIVDLETQDSFLSCPFARRKAAHLQAALLSANRKLCCSFLRSPGLGVYLLALILASHSCALASRWLPTTQSDDPRGCPLALALALFTLRVVWRTTGRTSASPDLWWWCSAPLPTMLGTLPVTARKANPPAPL